MLPSRRALIEWVRPLTRHAHDTSALTEDLDGRLIQIGRAGARPSGDAIEEVWSLLDGKEFLMACAHTARAVGRRLTAPMFADAVAERIVTSALANRRARRRCVRAGIAVADETTGLRAWDVLVRERRRRGELDDAAFAQSLALGASATPWMESDERPDVPTGPAEAVFTRRRAAPVVTPA